jgi:hypothetical protein
MRASTMSLDQILVELTKLNRAEKLKAMQVLVTALTVEEESGLIPGASYELITPYGNESAAQILYNVLQAAD